MNCKNKGRDRHSVMGMVKKGGYKVLYKTPELLTQPSLTMVESIDRAIVGLRVLEVNASVGSNTGTASYSNFNTNGSMID